MQVLRPLLAALALLACAAAQEPLASARAVRELAPETAAKGLPVKIAGVISFANQPAVTLFLHDGKDGVFIEEPFEGAGEWPLTGDRVEVSGITGQGLFAPVIRGSDGKAPVIKVLSHGALPEPLLIDGAELARPELDCDWITLEARVREVYMNDGDIVFECQAGTCDSTFC